MPEPRTRTADRPLSPHIWIYKWPITMGTSILHRITGVGLAFGTLLLAWWLVAAASGPVEYAVFQDFAFNWFGRFILFGFTVALMFHLFNGIRHLFWDFGLGFKVPAATRNSVAVYVLTIVATWIVWALAYLSMGKL